LREARGLVYCLACLAGRQCGVGRLNRVDYGIYVDQAPDVVAGEDEHRSSPVRARAQERAADVLDELAVRDDGATA
jgi:hypothetical protein